ncbi:MAG TPA: Asp23/Gls24 family envelope stress response protein [Gaiellaceae bacterium]
MTDGQSVISPDVLARYAADAAREVPGVHDVAAKGVKVTRADGRLGVELHLTLDWGANAPTVGAQVQARVAEVLAGMADARPATVDVVVDEWHSASSA